MKTIYISGKIDGCDSLATVEKFRNALFAMQLRFKEWVKVDGDWDYPDVINPMAIRPIPNGTWQDYIERDLIYLKHCDAIYMLKDWKDSAGARVEHEFAKKLGLEIIYEENERLEQRNEAQELVEENHAS